MEFFFGGHGLLSGDHLVANTGQGLLKCSYSTTRRAPKGDEDDRGFEAIYTFDSVGCGGFYDASTSGVIESPNFPLPYPLDLECLYFFTAEPGFIIKVRGHRTVHFASDVSDPVLGSLDKDRIFGISP